MVLFMDTITPAIHHPLRPLTDCKLVTREDESIPSVTMQNEDHTDIMDELKAMVGSDSKQPPNQLRSSMPESTLHWISKMIMKEAVEDKKMELTQAGMKIPDNDADVLSLFDTSELYGLINDGINKYNHRNTVQGCINDMVSNTNVPAVVPNSNEATYTEQEEINNLNEDLRHLRSELRGNINDDDHENNHDDSNLVDNGLNSNNTIGAHIV